MASSKKVVSPSEAAAALVETLARFRREGGEAEPVTIGAEGLPEAVVLPYAEYERLAAQRELAEAFASARGSVLAEVPGEFSPEVDADVAQVTAGHMTFEELEARTLDRWRRRLSDDHS
ncbi:MAG: type II toxin-antitoxin system prevent-host-death family antitoxin [Candidatus Dormibacteraeota bacterium]|nr:type II toxin-antitoxin system prevent-host-death family antitoxin [Candidatus Dormibacteraeota bacterium]MBO0761695.1 type II toxin-antitoxin system prevent-host-death family antitoxin [Candidatus Dormibacteraeota bacterium]